MKSKRIEFIDLSRGLAILFMIMVHVLEEMSSGSVYDSWFGSVIEFLGGPPAAPVFMFLMGTSMMFSKKVYMKTNIIRGVKLLALAYFLNIIREVLPALAFNEYSSKELTLAFWVIDILHFSGMAIIILSVIRKKLRHPVIWIGLGVLVAGISPLLWGNMSGNPILDWFLTLLWGTGGEAVAFPVFPWLSYPLFGMAFGYWLKETDNQKLYVNKSAIVGLCCLITGSILVATNYEFHIGDYWRTGPGGIIWITGFVLISLFLSNIFSTYYPKNTIKGILHYWSSHVTAFFVIHWIIIGWLSFFIEVDSVFLSFLMMIGIASISDLCTRLWSHKIMKNIKLHGKNFR